MGVLIRLLASRAAGPVCAGLATVLAVALVFALAAGKAREGVLRRALAAAQSGLSTCRVELDRAGQALDSQARAVAALKAEGERRTQAAARAMAAVRDASTVARAGAATILAARPAGEVCQAADRLILETLTDG